MMFDTLRIAINATKYAYHVGTRDRKIAKCYDCHWMGSREVIFCPACGSDDIVEPPHPDDFETDEIPWDELNDRFERKSNV